MYQYLGLSSSALDKFSKEIEEIKILHDDKIHLNCKKNEANDKYSHGVNDLDIENNESYDIDNNNDDKSYNNNNDIDNVTKNDSDINRRKKYINPRRSIVGTIKINKRRSITGTIKINRPPANNEIKIMTTETMINPYSLRYDDEYQKIDKQTCKNLNFLDFYFPNLIQSYFIPIGLDGLSMIARCPYSDDSDTTLNPNPITSPSTSPNTRLPRNTNANANPNHSTSSNVSPNINSNPKLKTSNNGDDLCIGYIIPMINNLIKNKSLNKNKLNTNKIYVSSLIIVDSDKKGNHIYDILLGLCYQTGIKAFFAVEEYKGEV
jgi:hypothetical protein